jgi:hypothetical protein
VASSKVRHTVGGEATGPSSSTWCRSVSISAIASPPAASITATSTHTWPRSYPGVKPRRANAVDKPPVSPTRSASSRTATAPASGTTPSPSAVTDNPCDHDLRFTCEVPSSKRIWTLSKSKFPLQVRHFRHSELHVSRPVVNDLG